VLRNGRIEGAVLYGDTLNASWYFQLMRDGTDVTGLHDQLIFGNPRLGDAGHGSGGSVAAMADEAEICGCNGVCKGAIVHAIIEKQAGVGNVWSVETLRRWRDEASDLERRFYATRVPVR